MAVARLHLDAVADFADHRDISTTRGYNEASLEAWGSYSNIMGGNFAALHTILGQRV